MKIIAKIVLVLICSHTILFSSSISLTDDSLAFLPARTCYTMQLDSLHRAKYGVKSIIAQEKLMKKIIDFNNKKSALLRTHADTIYIPIIVHVIHNGESVGVGPNLSSAQIYSQFDVLNEDFNKQIGTNGFNSNPVGAIMLIKFVPASKSPEGVYLAEPGIHRVNGNRENWTLNQIENQLKTLTGWNPTRYFNIWTARFGGTLASTLGYTQFPSFSNLNGLESEEGLSISDGVVIRFNVFGRVGNVKVPYNLGRTVTHEVGHFFGLRHIWGDEDDCQGTDYCDDTPQTTDANYGCPTNAISCVNNIGAMYQNYMDYSNDACMNIFTNNQKARIMAVLQNSPRRKELPTSDALIVSNIPKANFSANQNTVCMGNTITFNDLSKKQPLFWQWKVTNQTNTQIVTSSSQNFAHKFDQPDIYSVQLIIRNTFGADSLLRNNFIQVLDTNLLNLPYKEDFESTVFLDKWLSTANGDWKVLNPINANLINTKSLCLNGDNKPSTPKLTQLISPKFDFKTFQNAYLTFDLSYQYQNSNFDTLSIYYSTNCGQSYNLFWQKAGRNLVTWSNISTVTGLNHTVWRTEQISLDFLNLNRNVYFKISHTTKGNNLLFLDNITISVPTRTSVPTSNFTTPVQLVCLGENIQFSDQSSQYPTTWKWKITEVNNQANSLTSYIQNPEIEFNIPGIYTVELTANNGIGLGNTNTKIANLTVNSNPIITLTASETLVNCGNEVKFYAFGGNKYVWYNDRNIEPVTTITNFTISNIIKYSTNYYVLGTDRFGCGSYSNTVRISVQGNCDITLINDSTSQLNYSVYPSPASNFVKVDISEKYLVKQPVFILYSILGNQIITKNLEKQINTIDISQLERGMYYYIIGNEQGKLLIID